METSPSLLLVSADLVLGGHAFRVTKAAGFTVERCLSPAKALEKLASRSYPVVVIELGIDGLELGGLKAAAGDAMVFGFAGHVRTELLQDAASRDVTTLTNGQLNGQGEAIFAKVLQKITQTA